MGQNCSVVNPQLFGYVVSTNIPILLYFSHNSIAFIRNRSIRAKFVFDLKIIGLKTLEPALCYSYRHCISVWPTTGNEASVTRPLLAIITGYTFASPLPPSRYKEQATWLKYTD
ncbi:hypothetical protein EVAR_66662_1 [Eumeta japonica]|uniref:Uncharacterized protein n=1 Tax=Eumeta variegata TaxID=151549 RepID=A0A4C1ZBS8_EUMVA|nr:hypothetical protein EVAR_66662_1 [Eumeta japonica]